MNNIRITLQKPKIDWILIGTIVLIFLGYLFLYDLLGGHLLEHCDYDSYTLQALAWKNGRIALDQHYSWLELAFYNGNYFVSFPPFPSLVMYPLVCIFGEETPSNLVIVIIVIMSVVFAYECFRKIKVRDIYAMFWAIFFVIGSNMVWMSKMGGVWFLAQSFNLLLCFAAVFCVLAKNKSGALILIALAIGCRPFSICLFVVCAAYFCYEDHKVNPERCPYKIILTNLKHLIIPAVIFIGYMIYNYARFDNPFEFGHNYLPEFQKEENPQFGFRFLAENIKNVFVTPIWISENLEIHYPLWNGFMFYIANPIFIVWFIMMIRELIQKKFDLQKGIVCLGAAVNFFLLLLHNRFGGWQFGTRYLVDLMPYLLLYFLLCNKERPTKFEGFLCVFAVLFNAYGALSMPI